jgi:hypothetical protein
VSCYDEAMRPLASWLFLICAWYAMGYAEVPREPVSHEVDVYVPEDAGPAAEPSGDCGAEYDEEECDT